jgi:hypothetical protein
MNEIYEAYKDHVNFYLVYIWEAHPIDGWHVFSNLNDDVLHANPKNSNERAELAGVCMLNLGFTIPILLDNMQNEVDNKYVDLPERLYVLNKDGEVYYRGIMGSPGFNVDTWFEAIKITGRRIQRAGCGIIYLPSSTNWQSGHQIRYHFENVKDKYDPLRNHRPSY